MKNAFMLIPFLLLSQALHAQDPYLPRELSHDEYRTIAREQTAFAAVLGITGTALAVTGGAILSNSMYFDPFGTGAPPEVKARQSRGSFLLITGLVLDGISIPLLISASQNRRHARAVSTTLQPEIQWMSSPAGYAPVGMPGAKVVIRF